MLIIMISSAVKYTMRGIFHILTHLILTITLRSRVSVIIPKGETEAWQGFQLVPSYTGSLAPESVLFPTCYSSD